MSFALKMDEELFGILEKRVVEGWMLVSGPIKAIEALENNVYPPFTEENKNFETATFPIGPKIMFMGIAKKTERLRRSFGNDKDFDRFIMVHYLDSEGLHGAYRTIVMKHPGRKEDFRTFVREQLFSYFQDLEKLVLEGEPFNKTPDELWEHFKRLPKKKTFKKKRRFQNFCKRTIIFLFPRP